MSYESTAEPIKLGYLMDFKLPDGYPAEMRADLTQPFELVFEEGLEQGVIDRPVEILYREVEGLPKGTVKAVIDAYGELVDEGCLLVFGPAITDNCEPTKAAIEERFHVPAISVTGSEEWLGEWTFSLSMGSMTDEPIFWAAPPRQARAQRRRRAGRAVARRRDLHQVVPRRPAATRASASSPRSRSRRRPRTSATPSASCTRPRCRRSCTAASASASCSSGPRSRSSAGIRRGSWARRSRTRGSTPIVWNAMRRLDRARPVRRGEPGRPGVPRPLRRREYGRRPEYCVRS